MWVVFVYRAVNICSIVAVSLNEYEIPGLLLLWTLEVRYPPPDVSKRRGKSHNENKL
jgi:hypothetical protein